VGKTESRFGIHGRELGRIKPEACRPQGAWAHPGDGCGPIHRRESGPGHGGAQMAIQLPALQLGRGVERTLPLLRRAGEASLHSPGQ
jgi:hypothetical protein